MSGYCTNRRVFFLIMLAEKYDFDQNMEMLRKSLLPRGIQLLKLYLQ